MMRTILTLTTIFSLMISCSPKQKEQENVQAEQPQEVNDLPYLNATLIDGTSLNARELPGNTIIILFFADCDHCEREATAIQEKLTSFKNYNLYFLSSSAPEEISKFAKKYKLDDQPNVKFGNVGPVQVIQTFGDVITPSLYIYSSGRKLVKQFNGETNVEEIIKFL